MTHEGDLLITAEIADNYHDVTEVTGNLYIRSNCTLPSLSTVGGNLYINSNCTVDMPLLSTVGGYLDIYSNCTLPLLSTVGGNLAIRSNCTLPSLSTVGGNLYINSNCTLPSLSTVGGNLYINSNCTLPLLSTVGGYLYISSDCTLPSLSTVGGTLAIHSNCTLPSLSTVGGTLDIRSNCTVDMPFLKGINWKCIDNYCFVIESTKKRGDITIYSGYNIEKVTDGIPTGTKQYVAEIGEFTAHGKTIKQAIEDCQYKAIADKLQHEPISKDTVITPMSYHLITGACQAGIGQWMESNNIIIKKITAEKLLPLLEKHNAYGLAKFKSLINW